MAESDDKNELLVTARHVVLPLNKALNDKLDRKNGSEPRLNVLLRYKGYESIISWHVT